ncbi:MAG: D-glycerate dehydrogenase [Thermoplasmatales archaeon]|nr:D-glycerate dehydrogenase [Thermoplasmatales archaeon]
MKPKIYVTRNLPKPALDKLEKNFDVEINSEDRILTKKELIKKVKGKDALLCLLTDKIDSDVIKSNPDLKVISNCAVGFDNIDVKTANKHRIPVCNTPGILTETTADLTWALMLSAARRIVESDKFNRAGKFKGWDIMLFLGSDVYGKTLGIIGAGRIGTAVAERSVGFNMKVLYCDNRRNKEIEKSPVNAKKVTLDRLLTCSDFVSLHVPLTKNTIHLIGEKELKKMKKTAYLINTSRGPVVDESALVKALKNKWIAGAGLDVYENEPRIAKGLSKLDNAVLTPHTGSASHETRTLMALTAVENAIRIIKGKKPLHIVNPEVFGR